MKICWLVGCLIVESESGFRAVGRGQVAEISDERAELLISKGLATVDLAAAEDLDPLSAEELADLKATGEDYGAAHAVVIESLARRRAIRAKVRQA